MWCWDSNPHESPPITTKPGLDRTIFANKERKDYKIMKFCTHVLDF